MLFTQFTALIALFLLPRFDLRSWPRRILNVVALGFAFLDIPVQVIQGFLYDLERQTWPTYVDLVDAMLLIARATGASQALLKATLAGLAILYLYFFLRYYRRSRSRGISTKVQVANS